MGYATDANDMLYDYMCEVDAPVGVFSAGTTRDVKQDSEVRSNDRETFVHLSILSWQCVTDFDRQGRVPCFMIHDSTEEL